MKKYLICFIFILSLFINVPQNTNAQTKDWEVAKTTDQSSLLSDYKNYGLVPELNITVPIVVELSVTLSDAGEGMIDVFNNTTKEFIYSYLSTYRKPEPQAVSIYSSKNLPGSAAFVDKNYSNGSILYLNGKSSESVDFTIGYNESFSSNSLTLSVGNDSPLPQSITISAEINGSMKTLVNNKSITSSTVSFPSVNAKKWSIVISYNQPFKLSEILINKISSEIFRKTVRFLATPGNSYSVYSNTESVLASKYSYGNNPNLSNATTIKNIGFLPMSKNTAFQPSDRDKDGVIDSMDNCPNLPNQDQADINNNNIGDACDDFDLDGVMNSVDNCLDKANQNQKDTDGDSIGDLCDSDESRLTEKYPVIVWFGIGFSTLVFLGLLFVAGNQIRKNNNKNSDSNNIPPSNPPVNPTI
ncbi:MAG: thrombospondin type 3 repeat-containing protein [Parcubacteria group bacterium]